MAAKYAKRIQLLPTLTKKIWKLFGFAQKSIDQQFSWVNMSERGEAKRDGAKLQKNSGRGKIQKGDAKWKNYVVDYKEYAKSISINKEMWAKICTDTFKVNRNLHPVLKLVLGDSGKIRLAVIEWDRLEELEECWEEHHD